MDRSKVALFGPYCIFNLLDLPTDRNETIQQMIE